MTDTKTLATLVSGIFPVSDGTGAPVWRLRDIELSQALRWSNPQTMRDRIKRNRALLETHGALYHGKVSRRESRETCYLTEGQALALASMSTARHAPTVCESIKAAFASKRNPVAVATHAPASNDIRIPVSAVADVEGEPRIRDLDLAESLNWSQPRGIRRLIERNRDELELHGSVCVTVTQNTGQRGRPGKAYYLNEGQALVIAALSRTDRAAQIRKAIVDVFIAYRRGQLVEVKAHRRRKPVNPETDYLETFDETRKFLSRFADQPVALVDVLAGCVARIEALERALEAA